MERQAQPHPKHDVIAARQELRSSQRQLADLDRFEALRDDYVSAIRAVVQRMEGKLPSDIDEQVVTICVRQLKNLHAHRVLRRG